jgi:hypothetical protein
LLCHEVIAIKFNLVNKELIILILHKNTFSLFSLKIYLKNKIYKKIMVLSTFKYINDNNLKKAILEQLLLFLKREKNKNKKN